MMNRKNFIGGLILLGLAIVLALFALEQWRAARSAKAQAKLSTSQAGAAIESGHDAAATIGNRMDADATTDQITRENEDAIRRAEGADAPVAAPLRDAGIASLCRRAAYQRDPRCVQQPGPR